MNAGNNMTKILTLLIFILTVVGCGPDMTSDLPAEQESVEMSTTDHSLQNAENLADDANTESLQCHQCWNHRDCGCYAAQYCGGGRAFCEPGGPSPGICDCF